MANELLIKVNDFEGPLDLLLHLIKETKMDIQNVPMLLIVDQYLNFIEQMQTIQLEIAGDYLVMAATLLEIKSRMLLPRIEKNDVEIDDNYETELDLQEQLIQQLIEYKQFKDISNLLKEKELERGQIFSKPTSNLEDYQQQIPLTKDELVFDDLLNAFSKMLQKQQSAKLVQAKIEMDAISVEEVIHQITFTLKNINKRIDISEFIYSKSSLIATFLAVLELTKAKRITFEQETINDKIYIKANENESTDNVEITSSL